MYPVSGRWDDAIRVSHEVVCAAEVYRGGTSQGISLNVRGGTVRIDELSNVRRTLSLACADVDLMPQLADDTLNPVDTDLKVWSGIRYAEGDTEMVPVGVFRITRPERSSLTGELAIEGVDYSGVLAQARFVVPWNTDAGASVVTEIAAMVWDVLPWVQVFDLTGSQATHPGGAWERDRWDSILQLADSIGADVAFDPDGAFIIRPLPTIAAQEDWLIDYGTESAVLMDAGVTVSSDGIYNAVTATGTDAGETPVSATVFQTAGPLAWRAGFKRPRFFGSPILKTTDECLAAAATVLARSLVFSQQITPTVAPNPALDVGDTLRILLPDRETEEWRLLSGASITLEPGPMPLVVRSETTGSVEGET